MNKKDISDKYNLMEISFNKLDYLAKNKLGNCEHCALLYGMPVVLKKVGKNNSKTQDIVSELAKYNHPSIALNYGFIIDSNANNSSSDFTEDDDVYIVRELVKGKNFNNITSYHLHDRLVLLYKLFCLMEYLHSFNVYYITFRPSKIIITDDLEIKLLDSIKINENILNTIKSVSIQNEFRFIHPDLLDNNNNNFNNLELSSLRQYDLYSFGCLMYYSISGNLPWKSISNKEDIVNHYNKQLNKCFLNIENNNNSTIMFNKESNENTDRFEGLILNLLNNKFDKSETVRTELESIPEVGEYIKNGTLKFDFKSECNKVIENITVLVNDIEKLFDDNNLPKHFNSINQTKFKFFSDYEIDFTKA